MRLLDRYLLRELLLPLGFCLGGFIVFWMAFDLIAELPELQKARLHGLEVAEYYLVRTPGMLVIILPVALLLALLYALTQHARHHEITAIRSAGVSLWRLSAPYLGVGLLFSLALFALNELIVPQAGLWAEDIKTRHVRPADEQRDPNLVHDLGLNNAPAHRKWHIGTYNLDTGEMQQVDVRYQLADGTFEWLYADRAIATNGGWGFFNVKAFRPTSATNSMLIPFLQTNYLARPNFTEIPADFRDEYQISGSMSLRKSKQADIPLKNLMAYLWRHPNLPEADQAWMFTKLHGRLASPWTCLVVVLIAIPFGAPSGRRNVFVGVASSIFICFAYFVLLQLGLAMGSGGWMPPWIAAWLPNLVFGGTAVFLINRVR